MGQREIIEKMLAARRGLRPDWDWQAGRDDAAEGGCGVIGMASSEQVAAKHMLQALKQMRNRGNGKGGGIAAVGLVPREFGVSKETLENDYLIAVAYMDPKVRAKVEKDFIRSIYVVDHVHEQKHMKDYRKVAELEVRPPDVVIYFVRIKPKVLKDFMAEHDMMNVEKRRVEDEIVYQNTYKLNTTFYQSTGEKQAFVLSHGKNLLVLKMVGYGDDVIEYYQIENMHAHVWIGHHRYPTKGRVWHPGGAHPFIGLNEALVHNGDFANHSSISEYLAQRNIYPLFLTDTEVAVQVFDLLHRTYNYPLEYVIEALAPTTERDFHMLPQEKQRVYEMLQTTHMHCSPDGPWFFLIAQSDTHAAGGPVYRLTGITDTSMLRPQVFAYQERTLDDGHKVAIGFAASEKQGIDAALESLAETDKRFWPRADKFWNARGGSHTDGGAFLFSVKYDSKKPALAVTDKFGHEVKSPVQMPAFTPGSRRARGLSVSIPDMPAAGLFKWMQGQLPNWNYGEALAFISGLGEAADEPKKRRHVIDMLTLLMDRRYPSGQMRRSSLLTLVDACFADVTELIRKRPSPDYVYHKAGVALPKPNGKKQILVLDASGYTAQDETSLARELQRLYEAGFTQFMLVKCHGHRFIGNGFAENSKGVRIDVYGSPGDYLASGADGMEIHVHNNGQDQLAQIMKTGKLVVHGDVGQTFMYGAKGGEAYILGNAAGRPLINAVGKPRVVINGTCLDYLAESFMAGDPLNGGGFVVLNGMAFDDNNELVSLETPYPGSNLFSLASGGAIYVRDPRQHVAEDQLNGGRFVEMTDADWALIEPYLEENARLFGISIDRLLTVDGETRQAEEVYRKIRPSEVRALQAEEAWIHKATARRGVKR
ncbi:MAG: glutamate synthase [Anaerolineae bacterium]|nr:MAG: glutamate synthase [Anaerolineae bacterium]